MTFLDNRSFRDAGRTKSGDHFGPDQVQWISKQVQRNQLNWLISGDQFFGGYHQFESFQGNHPQKFLEFKKTLKARRAKYLLVSGDRHLSEVMVLPKTELGQRAFEVTSSPIHSSVFPGALKKAPNPLRRHGIDGQWSYIVFDFKKGRKDGELKYESRGLSNNSFFKGSLSYQ